MRFIGKVNYCTMNVDVNTQRDLQALYSQVVSDAANFKPQGLGTLIGNEFSKRLDLTLLRQLALDWRAIFNDAVDGPKQLDDNAVYAELIMPMLAKHAAVFLPMVDALRAAGYVKPGNSDFQIKFRLQQRRHENAAVWHMDNGRFQTYADDGTIAQLWNSNNSRALVTAACLRVDEANAQQPETWHNCGTQVAVGVPVLSTAALNSITERVYAVATTSPNDCNRLKLRNRITKDMLEATEEALEEFQRTTGSLQAAGVQIVTLENGVIADYNDFMFHRANRDVPEDYQRVFFVATAHPTNRKGVPQLFRLDTAVSRADPVTGQQEVVNFMFEYI